MSGMRRHIVKAVQARRDAVLEEPGELDDGFCALLNAQESGKLSAAGIMPARLEHKGGETNE